LRTLYLHGILSPLGLFIAERSALKRASQWLLKQMIMSSGSQDISDLVSGDLVITNWSADNSVNTDHLETFWYNLKGLLKGFQWPFRLLKLVKYSWSYGLNEVCNTHNTDFYPQIIICPWIEQRTALRWLGYIYFKNNTTPICRTIGSDHMVGCSCVQTTIIMYLRTVCLRINLRLNNIFCCLSNFTFLSTLIIKSSNHKSVSGHLW